MDTLKLFTFFTLLLVSIVGFGKNGEYVIKGKISNTEASAALLFSTNARRDTVPLKNGKFEIKGSTDDPVKANLILFRQGLPDTKAMAQPSAREVLSFYVEPGKIKITAKESLEKAVITGSKLNKENQKLTEALKVTSELRAQITELYKNTPENERNSESFMGKYKSLSEQYTNTQREIVTDYIQNNPDSWLSLDQIKSTIGGYAPDVNVVEPLFNSLSERVRNTKSGKEYAETLVKLHKTAIGVMAPDFTQNNPDGKPIKLSDFRGKYVLVDFWASWCGPCRAENPNVVKTYNEFKDKNFTILGVSLDRDRDAWLKAIEKDNLTWTHVSDIKYWNNEVAKLYMVRAIPDNFLIGPDGKIIGRGLRGEALREKLAELLK